MSVRDLIWVEVCQALKQKDKFEFEKNKIEAEVKNLETAYLVMADIRAILRDSNWYERISAVKGSGIRHLEPLNDKDLPSLAYEAKKAEEEMLAKMTEEERIIYRFNKGEKISF